MTAEKKQQRHQYFILFAADLCNRESARRLHNNGLKELSGLFAFNESESAARAIPWPDEIVAGIEAR